MAELRPAPRSHRRPSSLRLAAPPCAGARLREAGARFRNDILEGPGGKQVLLEDPSGNVVELFQRAALAAPG
ncbi:MAG: hypothetical protein JO127_09805 [Caulobacteraceae bacterium]|nr:hypothetical protein [Caulobacteraceae bacterium]